MSRNLKEYLGKLVTLLVTEGGAVSVRCTNESVVLIKYHESDGTHINLARHEVEIAQGAYPHDMAEKDFNTILSAFNEVRAQKGGE